MSDLIHSIEPDTLLAHHAWMRRLARRLVLDDAEADDVVQEAWLKATERPPDNPGALRAWLATVVRNAAKQLARSESRRDRRELAAARPEALPGTADLVARAEARRLLLDATLALDEPNRSTVLLRFFEGLPPREIAKRQGVPVETVRSRVRRALAEMRKGLDLKVGDRDAWAMALLPLAAPPLPGAVAPGEIPTDAAPLPAPATPTLPWAAAAAALVVAGGAAGWLAAGGDAGADDATIAGLRDAIRDERAAAAALVESRRQLDDRPRATRAEHRTVARDGNTTAPPPETQVAAEPRDVAGATGATTPFPAYTPALASEDWTSAGHAFAALIRAVRDVAEPVAEGDRPTAEAMGTVQERSGPVIALALRLRAHGVPGAIPNLVLAHPAVLTNLLPPTLAALGEPLSAEQRTRLERVAWDGLRRYDEARAALGEDDILLRRMAVESAALGAWLADVDAVLTPRQRRALRPEEMRGRAGVDLVSPGLLWPALPPRVEASAAEEYVRKLDALLLAPTFPEGTSEREAARDILQTWAAGLPAGAFAASNTPLDATGFAPAERLAFWAERTADLLEALRDGAAATRAQREQLARRILPLIPFLPRAPTTETPR